MKFILILLFAGLTTVASAQQTNTLLAADFWKNKPGVELVKAEVAKGANPAELNAASFDPVVLSINADAPDETVLYLMEQPGNGMNKLTHDGRTYVFWAAYRGNTELMKYCISKGAKLDLIDNHGYSAFNFAATTGQQNTAVYDLLLQQGAQPLKDLNHDGANAILLAIGSDPELKLTNYFQSKGFDLKSTDAEGNTAFDYAARTGNLAVMQQLLAKGIRPTANAMLMAAQGTRKGATPLAVYQYLESIGVNPAATAKNGNNALHAVVRRPGQAEVIQYFVGKGVSINAANAEGNTPFMNAAASNRDTATLALLMPLVKDINQQNKAGAAALALAVRSNSPEVVQYLLAKGARANGTDAAGNSLVYYLFESYSPSSAKAFGEKMKLLQAAGVNLLTPSQEGNTIYHLAAAKNDVALLKAVQPLGADVNAINKDGLTALHKAAMVAKDDATLQYLLSIGARKDSKTTMNETAYDLAKENELLTKQAASLDFLK